MKTDGNRAGPNLLAVDDDDSGRRLLLAIVRRHGYKATGADSAKEARRLMDEKEFELVLTDMNMPGESGLDLVRHIHLAFPDTATIMVTAQDDAELAEVAIRSGSYGYITKPYTANEIVINVINALRRRELELESRLNRDRLEVMVKERTQNLWEALSDLERSRAEVRNAQEETVYRLSIAAEFRDDETARHIQRMSHYCELLARAAGEDAERAELIRLASVMHDIGKIGIPDSILRKPGPLTDSEYQVMRRHALFGYKILANSNSELVRLAAAVALTHHERIDGQGYPDGISGERIPLVGKIAAIADVFDALTSDRVYRKALPLAEALKVMREQRGGQFDADLLDMFFSSMPQVLQIKSAIENERRHDPRARISLTGPTEET